MKIQPNQKLRKEKFLTVFRRSGNSGHNHILCDANCKPFGALGGSAPERRSMKIIVKAITILALLAIAVGGSALDSANIIIPTMIIMPGLAWMILLIWVNKENLI